MPLTKYSPSHRGGEWATCTHRSQEEGMETQKARECVSLREEGIGKGERQGVCLLPLRSIEDTDRDKKEGTESYDSERQRATPLTHNWCEGVGCQTSVGKSARKKRQLKVKRETGGRGGSWWLRESGKSAWPESPHAEFYTYLSRCFRFWSYSHLLDAPPDVESVSPSICSSASAQLFGPEKDILAATDSLLLHLGYIHDTQRIKPNDFGDLLSFPQVHLDGWIPYLCTKNDRI